MKHVFLKNGIALLLAAALVFSGGCAAPREEEQSAYAAGMEAFEQGDLRAAMACFQDAVRAGDESRGYRGQGLIYLRESNYYNATAMFSRCLETLGNSEQDRAMRRDIYLYQIESYQKNGQTDLARDLCNDLLDLGGAEAQALILRGELSAAENDMDAAREDFRAALDKDPSYENYLRVYETYEKKSRLADGAAYLFEALEKQPRTESDEYEVGRIYYVLGETDSAKEHLSRAYEGSHKKAGILLAKIRLETEDVSGARAIYRAYLETEEDQSTAYNGLALCDLADGRADKALENIQMGLACEDHEARESLLFNEIIAYEQMHNFETARDKVTAFLQIYPTNEAAIRENLFLQNR